MSLVYQRYNNKIILAIVSISLGVRGGVKEVLSVLHFIISHTRIHFYKVYK